MAHSEWRLADSKGKVEWKVRGLRPFNFDLMMDIDAYLLGAYVKYTL